MTMVNYLTMAEKPRGSWKRIYMYVNFEFHFGIF
jgi:hypothetical protein